ncbi:microfibril-associated glycoprotein 4-like [Convolutriloba macropyga]|uniref:microfibril-associated glycoprotein 4-like n=1 Tax=Convolutriloba macropyga TaxID=536237 RepID=UPI003F523073
MSMSFDIFKLVAFSAYLMFLSVCSGYEYYYMTDVDLNTKEEDPVGVNWHALDSQCRLTCYERSDTDCNAAYFEEDTGRCGLYELSGYHNKIMRLKDSTSVRVPTSSKWIFQYATEDSGWVLVLKRVFGDINFSGATWSQMRDGISGKNDYWAGLQALYVLTFNGKDTLRVKFSKENVKKEVIYQNFLLADESGGYQYSFGVKSGDYFDCLALQSGYNFTTADDPFLPEASACISANDNLPNWYNYDDPQCNQFNWFGALDTGERSGVSCDSSSVAGMKGCLSVCSNEDTAFLDYLIIEAQ